MSISMSMGKFKIQFEKLLNKGINFKLLKRFIIDIIYLRLMLALF